jgi:hypothetical protein
MSTGADTSKYTIATIWLSTKKLTNEAILNLSIFFFKFEKICISKWYRFVLRRLHREFFRRVGSCTLPSATLLSLDNFGKRRYLDESPTCRLFDTQKVMANVVGNIITKVFYSYIHNYRKQMCSNFQQIKSKSAHRNNKSSKTAISSSSLVNLADSSKLK